MFEAYKIGGDDAFDIGCYPDVKSEVTIMSTHLNRLQGDHKAEIVVSFLKDHCIRTIWFRGNEDVVKMLTSGFLATRHIESLFNSCKHNRKFLADFEHYISLALVSREQ